jgi:hypothetical protein
MNGTLTAYAASSVFVGTNVAVKVVCSGEENFKINGITYKANFSNSFFFGTLFGAVSIPLFPLFPVNVVSHISNFILSEK